MCHKLALGHDSFTDKGISFHHGASAAHFRHERHVEYESIARHYLLAEFHVVDFHEVSGVSFWFAYRAEHQQSAGLGHGFDHEHSGHHGLLRKVSLEIRLIAGDVFNAYDMLLAHVDDFVDKQERIAVGQQFAYAVYVHQRLHIRIVDGSLKFLALKFLANLFGKRCVKAVARSGGYHFAFERTANEREIAEHIEEFVARGFVVVLERTFVEIAERFHVFMGRIDQIGYAVEFGLFHGRVVDDKWRFPDLRP